MKIKISVERFGNGADLRQTGSNLFSGCNAVFLVDGKKKVRKIYMTNTGKVLYFYVKNAGRNVMLQTDDLIYSMHTSHLTRKLWYIDYK